MTPEDSLLSSYTTASASWFATQPRFGVSWPTLVDALTPRAATTVEGLRELPRHHLAQEAVHLVLAALTLSAAAFAAPTAASTRDARWRLAVWLGLVVLGSELEAVGVLLTHEHMHPRFAVMAGFLPLKEMLWYGFLVYPCAVAASFLCLNPVAEALLAALLHSWQVFGYESVAYRNGIQLVASNPDFLMGNVNDKIAQGPWINVYANFWIAAMGVFWARMAWRWNLGATAVPLVGVAGLLSFCVVGMAPLNALKAVGCYMDGRTVVPTTLTNAEHVFAVYSSCAIHSSVTESRVFAFVVVVSFVVVLAGVRHALTRRDESFAKRANARWSAFDAWIAVFVPAAYHVFLGLLVLMQDADPEVPRGNAFVMWLTAALGGVGSCFLCALGVNPVPAAWVGSAPTLAVQQAVHAKSAASSSASSSASASEATPLREKKAQ